nr:MAG TPA: hypothetical protein [Bacteriophage sp.]
MVHSFQLKILSEISVHSIPYQKLIFYSPLHL